ncbi:MAG: hypothetical protein ACRDIY_20105 [Chloroflexota bacterium]
MDDSARTNAVGQWEGYVEQLRRQMPAAPDGLLNFYVKWMPWLAIVFGAISLFFLIVVGIVLAAVSPLLALGGASGISAGLGALVALVLGIATGVLAVLGGYWMLNRRAVGWWIFAIGIVVGILSNLVHLAIIGLIVDLAIGYIHVLVRPRYS